MRLSLQLILANVLPTLLLLLGTAGCFWIIWENNQEFEIYINDIERRQGKLLAIKHDLGYGKGIHNFKNYIIRHGGRYKANARESFDSAIDEIRQYQSILPQSNIEKKAMTVVTKTIEAYRNNLYLAEQLIAENRSIAEIDRKVKIDDTQAIASFDEVEAEFDKRRRVRLDKLITQQSQAVIALGCLFIVVLLFSFFNTVILSGRMLSSLNGLISLAKNIGDNSPVENLSTRSQSLREFRRVGEQMVMMAKNIDLAQKEQVKLARDLREINRDLTEKNIQLEQFAHVAAHDLREPARRIKATSEALLEDIREEVSSDARFFLESLNQQAEKMLRLIADLRFLTRVGYHLLPSRTLVNIVEVGKAVADEYQEEMASRGVAVEYSEIPSIEGFSNLVGVLYRNLISNALSHSKGPISIKLTCEGGAFGVLNTGSTISPELTKIIFQPFKRGEGSRGTGLGLHICSLVVQAHEGKIWVESGEDFVHFKFKLWQKDSV